MDSYYQMKYIGDNRWSPGFETHQMFDVLRQRIAGSLGVRVYSFEDLEHIDIDSIDSICLSDTKGESNSEESSDNSNEYTSLEEYSNRKVLKILRSIKKLERLHEKRKESKMTMIIFMDLIRDNQYQHVSMSLLGSFIKTCRMVPKAYYLHYFMYFLYYASYYHHVRATTDIIDETMKKQHQHHLACVRHQIKYLQYIINQSRK